MLKIRESNAKVTASEGKGIYEVTLITEGQGSSGYYSKELLEEYGALTFNENRPMFANHPTDEEFDNGRDITKLMARTIEAARVVEEDGVAKLKSKIKVRPEWQDFVEEYKDVIGLSIFASGEARDGEVNGQKTKIVESFDYTDPYRSIDFVVAAGRGGKVDRMVESAQRVMEMTANDKREALQAVLNDGSDKYSWVRDFDENVVYVETEGGLFQIEYTSNESGKIVLGDRTEVRATTKYVPVSENVRGNVPANPDVKDYTMAFEDEITAKVEALAESVATLVESLKPAEDDPQENEIDRAAVVESALEAGLAKSARDRVLKAVEAGSTPEDAIAAEKALRDEIVKEYQASNADAGSAGYVRESASGGTPGDLSGLKF
ncbi:prohead core protein protease [Stenotrophomonas virus Jojan60]|nr:prohead core protein protease [Stenotrophomonas virus Jojan60]